MKILVWGSTGLVGSELIKLALVESRVSEVIAPVRRKTLHAQIPKLRQIEVDFDHLSADQPWQKVDAVLCALGTTMKKAKSKTAFRKVDHDYVLQAGVLAQKNSVPCFVLNSAMGANENSLFFYNQVKGEIERKLMELQFQSLTLCRPGLITGPREEFRAGEEMGLVLSAVLRPILPKKMRPNPASHIAQKMLEAAIESRPGLHIISSEEMI